MHRVSASHLILQQHLIQRKDQDLETMLSRMHWGQEPQRWEHLFFVTSHRSQWTSLDQTRLHMSDNRLSTSPHFDVLGKTILKPWILQKSSRELTFCVTRRSVQSSWRTWFQVLLISSQVVFACYVKNVNPFAFKFLFIVYPFSMENLGADMSALRLNVSAPLPHQATPCI